MTHWCSVVGGDLWFLLIPWAGLAGDSALGLQSKSRIALIAESVLGSPLAPVPVLLSPSGGAIGGVIAFVTSVSAGCSVGVVNVFLTKSIVAAITKSMGQC